MLGCDDSECHRLKEQFSKHATRAAEGFESKLTIHSPIFTYGKALKSIEKLVEICEERLKYSCHISD